MLSIDDVKHVAKLSKLNLSDKELDLMQAQLSKILQYIDIIKKIDTSKVEPTRHIYEDSVNVFQSEKSNDFDVGTYFEHARNKQGKYIVTKKVLES